MIKEIAYTTLVGNLKYAGQERYKSFNGLQIPTLEIDFSGAPHIAPYTGQPVDINFGTGGVEEMLPVSDDYFIEVRDGAIAVGREEGFLFLSEKGWKALRPKIEKAYDEQQKLAVPGHRPRTSSFKEAEEGVMKFFKSVEKKTRQKAEKLRKKADEAEAAVKKHF